MPRFVVSEGHDAFASYETVLEPDTPQLARSLETILAPIYGGRHG